MTVRVLMHDKDPGTGGEHAFFVGRSVFEIYAHLRRAFSHRYACTLDEFYDEVPEADPLPFAHGVALPYDNAFLTYTVEGRIDDICLVTLKLHMPEAGHPGSGFDTSLGSLAVGGHREPLEFFHRLDWQAYKKGYNTTNPKAYAAKCQMVADVFETLEHHTTHWETEGVTHRWGGFGAPRVSDKAHRQLCEIGYTREYEGINLTRYTYKSTKLEVYHTHALAPRWGNENVAPKDPETLRAWLTDARRAVDMWEAARRTVFLEAYLQVRKPKKKGK